ncbi:GNAT family N-acetyltransferase [Microbacterium koreense]|uniref:GNAT family N-acetyltransferase n=1 Tax=Microbacterium koreense TaxID=323761 RepID=A0ABW2ZU64_9MICO
MKPVTLRTERLVLALPVAADVDAIVEACQDPDTQRYTTVPSPYERRHAEEFVAHAADEWAAGTNLTWAMHEGDSLAGMLGIHRVNGRGDGELGYWLSPWARGRGLLREGARAVIDWGFSGDGANLARLEWLAVTGNIASARGARALGFRYEGLRRRALTNPEGRDDAWSAALLRDDDRMPQPWPVLDVAG